VKGVEAIEPILKKTPLPANDHQCRGLQALLDGAEERALKPAAGSVWRKRRIPLYSEPVWQAPTPVVIIERQR
jgi:hypothetical protein